MPEKYCKFAVIFVLAAATTYSQDDLRPYRNKTAAQIVNMTSSTKLDVAFFTSRIGTPIRDLAAAIEKRALTPTDFNNSSTPVQAAKDTARFRQRVFLFPANYANTSINFKATVDTSLIAVVCGQLNILTTDTIPAGATIILEQRGRFNISSGATLFINGAFSAPKNRRIFQGAGRVIFGQGALTTVYPEWWGAKSDSTIDCTMAFKSAYTALPNGGVIELLSGGKNLRSPKGYAINGTVRIPSDKNTILNGNGATILAGQYGEADTLFLIQNGSQTSVPAYGISPTTLQPRHQINNVVFRKKYEAFWGSHLATAIPIVLVNSTGNSFRNIDVDNYHNALVFVNRDSGWCENNLVENWRIAACDTGIIFRRLGGAGAYTGTSSFATNKLSKVTITNFTLSYGMRFNPGSDFYGGGVGIYTSPNSEIYRNVWDQVVIFTKDSVKAVDINGKVTNLSGSLNIEYIGDTPRTKMYGVYFGSTASNLTFDLSCLITNPSMFSNANILYNASANDWSGIRFEPKARAMLVMSNATSTLTNPGAGSWAKVTDSPAIWAVDTSPAAQGITAVADSFTVLMPGNYRIDAQIIFTNSAATEVTWKMAVLQNGVANVKAQGVASVASASLRIPLNLQGYYKAARGDRFSLAVQNITNTNTMTVRQAQFMIERID